MGHPVIACVATGQSVTVEQVEFLRGRCKVLCVNDAWRLAPWADWMFAADPGWWKVHSRAVRSGFSGEPWTHAAGRVGKWQEGLNIVRSVPHKGAAIAVGDFISRTNNSGLMAVNLAVKFGARRILLVGYDMHGTHFFGQHPHGLNRASPYSKFIAAFREAAKDLKRLGVSVVNCTPGSALDCFPKLDLAHALMAEAA